MKTLNNELSVQRGETFTIDKILQNKDGSPYIVSKRLKNPFFLITISNSLYKQEGRQTHKSWCPMNFQLFNSTRAIDIKSILNAVDGTSKYSFDSVLTRELVPDETDKYYIMVGYYNGVYTYFDYDDFVFYDYDDDGNKVYKYWNIESETFIEYSCRLAKLYSSNVTNNLVSQTYYYDIKIVTGELSDDGKSLATIETAVPILKPTVMHITNNILGEL